ncbi:MAG: Holliday junction resolvase RuvX [Candidatus Beckwithbacteria bacterium]|nr:Holliday junction resolvase RuvX [Candidatus Beckwithbacteria bacterium]
MKYLCIDFGLKHLGLAIADGPLAETFGEKKYDEESQALQFIARLCEEQAINQIIFGLSEGKMAETTKTFVEKLKTLVNLPIFFQDESLSSVEAKQKLIAAHVPQFKRRRDHSAAAALILQDYLDTIELNKGGKENV